MEVRRELVAGSVLVHCDDLGEITELGLDRQPHGKIDKIVVEEGYATLQTVGHGKFILD